MRLLPRRPNPHLLLALALTVAYHGGLLLTGTFRRTYDAYVHIFFADHYARWWFDHWDYRWYTGFTLTSYPPGSQQAVALLSKLIGLQAGFVVVQLLALLLVIVGVYRFAKLWVSDEAAGYAALAAVFSSSVAETVHVFGQLPTMFSLGFLLNALPYVRRWLDTGQWASLAAAWAVTAATTAGHHVTTVFGAVFFIGPVMAAAAVERFRRPLPDETSPRPAVVTRRNFIPLVVRRLRRLLPVGLRGGLFALGLAVIVFGVVLPYWLWSRSDPITQVSIPHASRDSYWLNPNAGLMFWVIPYGVTLVALPYAFYRGLATRAWPLALSFGLLFFLGTGGTTPGPRLLLGGAYDILTLDRFTFWATIAVLPLLGEFILSLRRRGLARHLREQLGDGAWRAAQAGLVLAHLLASVFTANLAQFRRFQPDPLDMRPIVSFIDKDQHWRWRYLTLGFGDQMAWLSAQTTATTVDGNYHSARRLPELTSTPVERLEGAKFRGLPGIGSLQQFLAVPEKYNLKFVFSNDPFYDPLLYFSGWHRVQRLENGVVVWEREDIPPLPEVLPRKEIPFYQRVLWGTVPLTAVAGALLVLLLTFLGVGRPRLTWPWLARAGAIVLGWYDWVDRRLRRWSQLPELVPAEGARWQIWLDWLKRLPRPRPALPRTRHLRVAVLVAIGAGAIAGLAGWYAQLRRGPEAAAAAYYDHLDFRRFDRAYAQLDPLTRPSYDQFLLERSVQGGLVNSYGKLDAVQARLTRLETDWAEVEVETLWVTALAAYPVVERLEFVRREGQWYIAPQPVDARLPPDQFFRRGVVAWYSQGRRRVTTETTAFGDVLDRPEVQVLSARLARVGERYSVVGELINLDVDPADVTVTAYLYDAAGNELTWYNAQAAMVHKILPKEVTPFRVDFEGVAGAVLADRTGGVFEPGAFVPVVLPQPVAAFEVHAKAVVTARDLERDLALQAVRVEPDGEGRYRLAGELINNGTREATVPHVLITYYDEANQVVWVSDAYLAMAIRPQRAQAFEIPLQPFEQVETLLDKGAVYANVLSAALGLETVWLERMPVPAPLGYAALRLSAHSFSGGGD